SVEMYMDAYNQWGGYTSTTGPQSYKWQSTSASGYNVGVNGSYPNTGYQNTNSLSTGPNNIFMTSGSNWWWLASPSCISANVVLYVNGSNANVNYNGGSYRYGVCPVVCLGS
ncbi:MAG: hypothetical protein IJ809_02825, partial [Clostridia bacterium]|nr:hypothetical protein [Clostridia bacterium]